jgi:hypothetical protein
MVYSFAKCQKTEAIAIAIAMSCETFAAVNGVFVDVRFQWIWIITISLRNSRQPVRSFVCILLIYYESSSEGGK